MRALTRMRTLAAACALLLFVSGTAAAWAPTRPIDRTDSPPPPMVGDPDDPQGLTLGFQMPWGYVQFRLGVEHLRLLGLAPPIRSGKSTSAIQRVRRGPHAH